MEDRKRSRHGCLWALFILLALLGVSAVLVITGLLAVTKSSVHLTSWTHRAGADEFPQMNEIWSEGAGTVKVVRIPLRGLIMFGTEGSLFAPDSGSADMAFRSIRRARQDAAVKAIILDIDSGGGGITASDVLYKELLDFKESQTGRCVVAVFNDVAASGAYYVALAADRILAHPTAITGSIGVLMQSVNVKELAQKVGVRDVTIKSGENKDILNPFNDLSPEQRQILQGIVDELHSRFVKLVAGNRNLPETKVRELADGRIFTAGTALELGLVDEVGYWKDAVARTTEMLGVDQVRVFRYEEELSLSSLLRGAGGANPMSSLSGLLNSLSRTRLFYLWQL